MTSIAAIAADIRDTSAQIARISRSIAEHPNETSLLFNLRSLEKRMRTLENRFAEIAKEFDHDTIDYRILCDKGEKYPVWSVGRSLTTFQNMVTSFYDAIKSGPKKRGRTSAETAALTQMDFEYAFSGSLGFALTLANKRDMLESGLDMAVEKAFSVIHAKEMPDVTALAKVVGVAAMRTAYDWAKTHSDADFGAAIEWKHGNDIVKETKVDATQLTLIAGMIEKTSEVERAETTFTGTMVGYSVPRRYFEFQPIGEGAIITGHFSDTYVAPEPIQIPSTHPITVKLVRQTVVHYAIEKEEVSWELLSVSAAAQLTIIST